MRVVFFGTASFACPALRALARHEAFQVVGAVTQPDRPRGRQQKLAPSPVKETAIAIHTKVFQPEKLRTPAFISQMKFLKPDFIVVAAYGKILGPELLEMPKHGCFNIHASLLPKYRGAAPIHRAIMDGERETGVTIMKMDAALDTGDIVLQESTHIRPTDNIETLHDRLAQLGAQLLPVALIQVRQNKAGFIAQDNSKATYAEKVTRDDERIIWDTSKRHIWNQIRALYPGSGAYTYVRVKDQDKVLKVLSADFERFVSDQPGRIVKIDSEGIHVAAKTGAVVLQQIQLEGKKRMPASEFLKGVPLKKGDFLYTYSASESGPGARDS